MSDHYHTMPGIITSLLRLGGLIIYHGSDQLQFWAQVLFGCMLRENSHLRFTETFMTVQCTTKLIWIYCSHSFIYLQGMNLYKKCFHFISVSRRIHKFQIFCTVLIKMTYYILDYVLPLTCQSTAHSITLGKLRGSGLREFLIHFSEKGRFLLYICWNEARLPSMWCNFL